MRSMFEGVMIVWLWCEDKGQGDTRSGESGAVWWSGVWDSQVIRMVSRMFRLYNWMVDM